MQVYNKELYHYGVKGMKWGHKKAQKLLNKANIARESAKEWEEIGQYKAEKLRKKGKMEKAAEIEAKYKRNAAQDLADAQSYEKKSKHLSTTYAENNKQQADAGANRSRGAKLATNLLAGPFANRTYNSVIAAGGSKWKARAITAATSVIGGPLGHIVVGELYGHGQAQRADKAITSAAKKGVSYAKSEIEKRKNANK